MKTNARTPSIDQARFDQIIGLIRAGLTWAIGFIALFETCLPKRWLRKHLIMTRFAVAGLVMVAASQKGARQRHARHRTFHGQIIEQSGVRRRATGSALRKALSARGLKAGFAKLLEALDQLDALAARFARRLSRPPHRRFVFSFTAPDALLRDLESHQRACELAFGSAAPPFT